MIEEQTKNFLFKMLQESNGLKWLYDDTIINLISYIEHTSNTKCPIDKKEMVEEFKKVYEEIIQNREEEE